MRDTLNKLKVRSQLYSYEVVHKHRLIYHSDNQLLAWARFMWNATLFQYLPYYHGGVPLWRLWLRRLASERVLPNYAMIGPIKSGSSDLVFHTLFHPCLVSPIAKEIPKIDPKAWRPYFPTKRHMEKVREKHGAAMSGFLAPYMHWMELADSLHEVKPDMKIIISLRNPVSRAHSHWKRQVLLYGKERVNKNPHLQDYNLYVDMALDYFPSCPMEMGPPPRSDNNLYAMLQTGIYHKAVEEWMKRFGRENVLVTDIGDYFKDRRQTLDQIQDFLEIPHMDIPLMDIEVNKAPIESEPPKPETKQKLAEFYQPYNEKLFELIGQRFAW